LTRSALTMKCCRFSWAALSKACCIVANS
jgi:hypothetical protein